MALKDDPERDEAIRDALRLEADALAALRELCIRPGRNAQAQIAALRLRLEYTLARPASEVRARVDHAPLTVRFDLSGTGPPVRVLPSGEPHAPPEPLPLPPPGVDPGAGSPTPPGTMPTENFPLSDVSPTIPHIVAKPPVRRKGGRPATLPRTEQGELGILPQTAEGGPE